MDFPKLLVSKSPIPSLRRSAQAHSGIKLFKPGLNFKLSLIVIAISLVSMLISCFVILTLRREQLIHNAQTTSVRLSNVIEASLEHAMLSNDRAMAIQIIQSVVSEESVEKIRILDIDGVVHMSSNPAEIGQRFERGEAACQFCHEDGTLTDSHTPAFSFLADEDVLLNVNFIRNRPRCTGCHAPETEVLGLLMIELPMTDLQDQLLAGLWQIGLADLATAVVLVGLMMLALGKFVVRPVRELARGADEIGGGNLDHPVRLASQDELGNLARTFDAMRQRLKESLAGLERRNRELSVLNDVALAASQLLDLQQIFDLALDTVVNQLGMQAGAIYLRDEDTGRLAQRACLGLSEAQCQEIERLRGQSGGDISEHVVETGAVTFVADMAGEDRFQGFWDDMRGRSYVNIPLKSKGAVVGTMGLVTYAGQPLTGREVEVLKAVGHEIGTAIDNASLLAETRRGKGEAENLYRLGTRISASLVLGQVLDAVAEAARQVLAADLGVVGLLDAAGREVSVQAAAGASTEILRDLRIPVGKAGLASGRPLIIEECSPDLPIAHAQALMAAEGVVSLLVVPLEHRGRLLGLVGVMTRQRRRFTVHDVQLLTRLGHQVVVAIENARLYRQVRRLAILEERDRLAREMHDHLAQGLGYLTIRASILSEVVAGRKTDRIQAGLVELRQIANEIYSDVRADIFNLRSADLSDFGFLPALREYLNEYRAHHSLEVELVIDSDSLAFAPDVEVQLLHIIQEALANVRKHAQASHVWVRFEQQDPLLHITVEDDGRGFDPARLGAEGGWYFGLQIMRERAESIGGSLELDSSPSQGTQVRVYIPYPTEK